MKRLSLIAAFAISTAFSCSAETVIVDGEMWTIYRYGSLIVATVPPGHEHHANVCGNLAEWED
jgi:hypothetical protein